jgi:hypothetical protein
LQFINQKLAIKSLETKEFANELKENYKKYNQVENDAYYYICNNGNFYTSSTNVMKMVKLMLYITKGVWYIPICAGKDNITCMVDKNKTKHNHSIKRIEYLMIKKIIV